MLVVEQNGNSSVFDGFNRRQSQMSIVSISAGSAGGDYEPSSQARSCLRAYARPYSHLSTSILPVILPFVFFLKPGLSPICPLPYTRPHSHLSLSLLLFSHLPRLLSISYAGFCLKKKNFLVPTTNSIILSLSHFPSLS